MAPKENRENFEPLLDLETEPEVPLSDALAAWMKRIENVPLLQPEEEIYLAKRIEAGDERAYHRLVESNLRLVLRVARKYSRICRGSSLSLEDLIQEGNIGLMNAARRFDYRKGFRFSTYALYWIQQAISRAVADKGRIIRLPAYMMESLSKISQATVRLTQHLGRQPTLEELARELGISETKLALMLQRTAEPLSFEATLDSSDGDAPELADFLPDKQAVAPDEAAIHASLHEQLEAVLSRLSPREQSILRLRFGLDDGDTHTLEEVASRLELSRERVRQIEKRALEKLREDKNFQLHSH
ncbi:MAG TPA: sigma-70 family RNA polymerase sigma factor [Armatimonadetes bacterium]|nr:sigma-70 family RNA polymerase sigma factor [Armatimonadota bacterium]